MRTEVCLIGPVEMLALALSTGEIWARSAVQKCSPLPLDVPAVHLCHRAYRDVQDAGVGLALVNLVHRVDSCANFVR